MSTPVSSGSSVDLEYLFLQVAKRDRAALRAVYDAVGVRLYQIILVLEADEGLAATHLEKVFVRLWSEVSEFDPAKQSAWQWLVALMVETLLQRRH